MIVFVLSAVFLAWAAGICLGFWVRGVLEAIDESDPMVPPAVLDRASRRRP